MGEKLVLIDGHSILNRAFFGLPDLTNSEGIHTNAVYGFLNILFKILEEEKPDYLTVAFDVHAPTFRHKMFDGYKGTRKPMAEELRQQVPLMKEMLRAMGINIVEMEGFEADDILGTLSVLGERSGMEVSIVSGDRDLLQLATEHVMIRIPKTKKTGTEIENYHAAEVKERYLVTPKEFIDVKALMGDTSDNIPGVPSIGEKTATELIAQYGSIENAHAHVDEFKRKAVAAKLTEFWDQAVMSKTLATIITDAPVSFSFEDAKLPSIASLYTEEAFLLCKRLDFKNLLGRFQVEAPKQKAEEHFVCVTDSALAEDIFAKIGERPVAFFFVADKSAPEGWMGLSIAFSEEDIYFFPCVGESAVLREPLVTWIQQQITRMSLSQEKGRLLAGKYFAVTPDVKQALAFFDPMNGRAVSSNWEDYLAIRAGFFDTTIAAYLLNPLSSEYPYGDIAKSLLGLMVPSKEELLGKLSPMEAYAQNTDKLTQWACMESYIAWKAAPALWEKLTELGMDELFAGLEMPTAFVLSDMEKEGIHMDAEALRAYGQKLSVSLSELEQKIYGEAGESFNINSPKQLGAILFEKLLLPNGKKTKTGYSTSAEVLEKLAPDYPIVADILQYRQLAKLKSTYADGLPQYVREDGKIHTTFNQTVTATGRLSSTDPNLQNIPIRIELGKLIRQVFYPADGSLFVDSDYSQIELRVLAHMSGDETMISAFAQNEDIHRITASQVFGVPFEEVTPLQRRNAKAVNFGIVYGISAFGLSQDLDIGRKEAQDYIDSYFATYPKIKQFLDRTVSEAKEKGYTATLFGRIRPIPELSSSNFMQRQFGERVAMNSPIQGTAADIIKIAMIRVHDRLMREGLQSRLILQVHDELLIETKEEEKDCVIALLEEEMRGAVSLSVAMEVGTETGMNWYDAH